MSLPTKQRLDVALLESNLVDSRAKAQALIMAGKVLVNDAPVTKAGTLIKPDAKLSLKENPCPWVSRGGLKLAKAITEFQIIVKDFVAIDVGCSTGGFTDVLLQHGTQHVYAVDVGHGQLDWSLRNHGQVTVLEKTNARNLTTAQIPKPIDIVVCDASFISLQKVLPAVLELCKPTAQLVALIKPQFEAGNFTEGQKAVDRGKGVIKDPAIHQRVCDETVSWIKDLGWVVNGLTQSPITGPKGNIEFLLYAQK